ncbi:hypothetical protein J5Y04_17550 [Kitasatospora sp. RG8]|uniref:hypothetical protein n=1 Tax=Kitasatospora sp. RG8 TaxID=2820815 RepID=UPI001ADF2DC9|nr:hypothetical protein [Kitasatospora sp. RG8]MBP0451336.1 hypothetical protein [Kitasatospora sp. RG8]
MSFPDHNTLALVDRLKRWLFDAPAFAMSVLTKATGADRLDRFVDSPRGREFFSRVGQECISAVVRDTGLGEETGRMYFEQSAQRIRSFPLTVEMRTDSEAGRRLLVSQSRDLLVEPAEYCLSQGRTPEVLGLALRTLIKLLNRP